jgi:Flp pilus assembly protein TadD
MLAGMDRLEGRSAEELEHARLAVRARSNDPEARYALGNALASALRSEEAEVQYLAALRLKPNFAGAEENLGVLYKWRGRLDLAIPHFRRAHELDRNLPAAAYDLAGALATVGQTADAIAVLEEYRRSHPEDRLAAELEIAIRTDRK